MPSPTSKFPSYGLVRGPSHEQGGVAGMVADEQPVELEGGEWIIPKEAVPDYLPVLQQITNEGRAMQQMDNGNSAMDALIASASMHNGLAQPKSPMYQEGGQVSSNIIPGLLSDSLQIRQPRGYVSEFEDRPFIYEDYLSQARRQGEKIKDDDDTRIDYYISKVQGTPEEEEMAGHIKSWMEKGSEDRTRPMSKETVELLKNRANTLIERKELLEDDRFHERLYQDELTNPMNPNYRMQKVREPKYQEGGPVEDYYKYIGLLKKLGKKHDVSMPEDMFTPGGGYTKEALAAMHNLTPETTTIDTLSYLDPSNVQFSISGETPSGAKKEGITHKQDAMLPIQEYVMDRAFKDDPFKKLDWESKLLNYTRGAFPKGFPKVQKQGGPVDYYQTGGQVQPRKQQEMRNPAMYYGPPIELMGPDSSAYNEAQSEFEAFMDSLETKRNTNPFTGKPMDTDADIKRLLERMKQSKIPRSGQRMIMRQGGPIPYQNGGEIPDARMMRPSPEAQERLLNDLRAQGAIMGDNPGDRGGYFPLASQVEPDALMGTIRSDRRIKPLEPDTYIQRIPNAGRFDKPGMQFPVYQEEVSQVPKLSTAYLASFGMETPLSREQQALLQRKMIAPETLNPKVKGLINRALVQRLANEED